MRRCRNICKAAGVAIAAIGIIVITVLIVSSGFWWFLLGAALIAIGLLLCRK